MNKNKVLHKDFVNSFLKTFIENRERYIKSINFLKNNLSTFLRHFQINGEFKRLCVYKIMHKLIFVYNNRTFVSCENKNEFENLMK